MNSNSTVNADLGNTTVNADQFVCGKRAVREVPPYEIALKRSYYVPKAERLARHAAEMRARPGNVLLRREAAVKAWQRRRNQRLLRPVAVADLEEL